MTHLADAQTRGASRPGPVRLLATLLGAAHPGPAVAVTVLAALLAGALGLSPGRSVLAVAAVLTSQLSIGWSNDLIDLARDRAVGRTDKPLAAGALPAAAVRVACGVVLVATVPLGLACGAAAALVHAANTAAGWAYNLGAKATPWSWVPYAVAFGGLPAFVSLAHQPAVAPAVWQVAAGTLLGVGAHVLNVLPDLADDEATGVRGLPHRLGARWSRRVAVAVLLVASVVIVLGAQTAYAASGIALLLVLALSAVTLTGRGRWPFVAAVGIAVVDVVLLVAAS